MSDLNMAEPSNRTIKIPVGGGEVIDFELDVFSTSPEEANDALQALEENNGTVETWIICTLEHVRIGKMEEAQSFVQKGIDNKRLRGDHAATIPLLLILANMRLQKAKTAPTRLLPDARFDTLNPDIRPKSEFHAQANEYFNEITKASQTGGIQLDLVAYMSRAILQLAQGDSEGALRQFESVLSKEPNNIVALMGKARILYTQRDPAQALHLFQQILRLKPDSKPDPRIGIGLCHWVLGSKEGAKTAWARALELDPTSWPVNLLMGLERLNASKDPRSSDDVKREALKLGLESVVAAFKTSGQTSSSAAQVISTVYALESGAYSRAHKLAEHAMQYADTRGHLVGGQIALARIEHAQEHVQEAKKMFETAAEESRNASLIADVGAGQLQIETGDLIQAKHTFESISKRWPNEPEVQAILASLLSTVHDGLSNEDLAIEMARSRELFTRVQAMVDASNAGTGRTVRDVGNDPEFFVEMAKIWHGVSLEKSAKAYRSAVRTRREIGEKESPQLVNNLAALAHLDGDFESAEGLYKEALASFGEASIDGEEQVRATKTTLLYNLGRAYEGRGKLDEARDSYREILSIHPEYADAKIRLAAMAMAVNKLDEANNYLKEALTAQPSNLELRAFYLYFLIQTTASSPQTARFALEFAYKTLSDNRNDVYTLCAAGSLSYRAAREAKPTAKEQQSESAMRAFGKEKTKNYLRAVEYFDRALGVDPECSFAAQGMAIAIAEDAFVTAAGQVPNGDSATRIGNARQALAVFQRVRESLTEGSVYVNMGHCYFANDEFERAIESYETALQRFYDGVHPPTLLCLARTWFTKANREGNFSAMTFALRYAQKAMHIQPHDKAILFNVAMIQQKAAEMLTQLPVERRTLAELNAGLQQASHSQKIFLALSTDKSRSLPYSVDTAEQRYKYGQGIMRRIPIEKGKQETYESQEQATVAEAKKRRDEEREKLAVKEAQRMAEIRRQAEELAQKRREAREDVATWVTIDVSEYDKKPSGRGGGGGGGGGKRKKKDADLSEDEGSGRASGGSDGEGSEEEERRPKKKSKSKSKKKAKKYADPDEEGASEMDVDGEEKKKPKAKPRKKKAVAVEGSDEEGAEPVIKKGPKKGNKKFISKETISDSDEEA